jgi:3',5'-cyclic AMP phosphodiesterase CpdA
VNQPLFSFAVIADTHTRPEEGDLSSPWQVNALANDRCRYVTAVLNHLRPAFVIHLGDVVHPVPALPTYGSAAQAALDMFADLDAEIRYIPGNHDVGDKPFKAMPAATVTDDGVALYERYFGAPFSAFDRGDCRFVLINSPVLNSGLAGEQAQRAWLENELDACKGKRVFLFTHYPPYILDPGEPSNYDNIDEPQRSWLLSLTEACAVEALFAGHVHNFFYHRHGVTDCYLLPATSFFRQDYAELFRIEAAPEHGRNDAEKLGFFMVDVYADHHIARCLRTNGETLKANVALAPPAERVATLHPRERRPAPVGVHLRHPWAEVVTFPYNGPMDEFLRKRARNDYTLMTLWELGVRKLRMPISDLLEDATRERMRALRSMGHEFTLFCFEAPTRAMVEALTRYADLVDVLEVVIPWQEAERTVEDMAALEASIPVPVTLAKLETSAEKKTEGSRFSHFVSYGFHASELDLIEDFLGARGAIGGFVFRLRFDDSPWEIIPRIADFARDHGVRAAINVRLASENPAEYNQDDRAIANQVAEAMLAAFASGDCEVFIDTYVDVDRGYFPRHGLFDRRYNPRPASFVYRYLQGWLGALDEAPVLGAIVHVEGGRVGGFGTGNSGACLLLPDADTNALLELPAGVLPEGSGDARLIDLCSGNITAVRARAAGDGSLQLDPSAAVKSPTLVIAGRGWA